MSDKPNVQLTIAKLKSDTPEAAPFVMGLSKSQRITFKDYYAADPEEYEKVVAALNGMKTTSAGIWEAIEALLEESDVQKLKDEKLSTVQLLTVIEAVAKHYEGHYGNRGE